MALLNNQTYFGEEELLLETPRKSMAIVTTNLSKLFVMKSKVDIF